LADIMLSTSLSKRIYSALNHEFDPERSKINVNTALANAADSRGADARYGVPSSGASPQWIDTGGSITGRIFVTSLGNLYAFARGTDNALWTNAQTSPDGPWGAWTSLGGVLASDPAAEFNGKDALEAFVVGSDGALWTIAQSSYGAPFSGWQSLGQTLIGDPTVIRDAGGNLHVFAVGSDHAL
jgi:hypothetical protein